MSTALQITLAAMATCLVLVFALAVACVLERLSDKSPPSDHDEP